MTTQIRQQHIDSFIEGYLTAALWSSTDTLNGEDVNLDDFEWADGQEEKLKADCLDFIIANAADLLAYEEQKTHAIEYGAFECAGHDFWLTRCWHGAGFWARGLGELGNRLTAASKAYGNIDLYLGDDELVYAYGLEG